MIIATAKQEPEMSRPPWGKGDRVSGGRGELALNPRLPPNQRTYPNHYHANKTALHTKGHTIPQASSPSPSPHGPTSPQRARLIYMRHYQLQVILATAKQEPLKSRPLWGKGDRASGGRGELASYLDCPPTNAPIPTHHANKSPHPFPLDNLLILGGFV